MTRRSNLARDERVARARRLRRDATRPEAMLWAAIRNRGLANLKFRRQHSIGPYFVDFYCAEHRLVIELDGRSHDGTFEYDSRRQAELEANGYRVLRIDNEDVLTHLDVVLQGILQACGRDVESGQLRTAPHPNPLPCGEREMNA